MGSGGHELRRGGFRLRSVCFLFLLKIDAMERRKGGRSRGKKPIPFTNDHCHRHRRHQPMSMSIPFFSSSSIILHHHFLTPPRNPTKPRPEKNDRAQGGQGGFDTVNVCFLTQPPHPRTPNRKPYIINFLSHRHRRSTTTTTNDKHCIFF